jgi:hypothetical protein
LSTENVDNITHPMKNLQALNAFPVALEFPAGRTETGALRHTHPLNHAHRLRPWTDSPALLPHSLGGAGKGRGYVAI